MRVINLSILIVFTIIAVSASASAQPANDMWANAMTISGTEPGTWINDQTNVGATLEPGEPASCAGCGTVWYKWTAPSNLSMTFHTGNANGTYMNDTVLGVYKGAGADALTMVTWNDDWSFPGTHYSKVTFIAEAGQTYYLRVYGSHGEAGTFSLWWEINNAESSGQFNFALSAQIPRALYQKSEFAIFRPSDGQWWALAYNPFDQTPYGSVTPWGLATDELAPGDYDGDGYTDAAIWRPENGTYWIRNSHDGTVTIRQWGIAGDEPVQGDFDGDDRADLAIWRPATSTFWVLKSSDGTWFTQPWGVRTDKPICGDYDGDGRTDFAVIRDAVNPSYPDRYTNEFWILNSSDGTPTFYSIGRSPGVRILFVPGDYDGDGKGDLAITDVVDDPGLGDGSFYYRKSSDGEWVGSYPFVGYGYLPVAGDYFPPNERHSISDLCAWADGYLYCYADGGTGGFYTRSFGMAGDVPVAFSNVH